MPSAMTQDLLTNTVAAAAKEVDRLKAHWDRVTTHKTRNKT